MKYVYLSAHFLFISRS